MVLKRILALGIILTLVSIIVYNTVIEENSQDDGNNAIFVVPEGTEYETGGIDVGDIAPNFQLETLNGDIAQLNDYKGKKIFLNFWASWCGPCKAEMPHMQKFHEEYGDEVVILAVNTSEPNIENARDFVEDYGLTFPVLLDRTSEVALRYQATGLPTTYYINTKGEIQLQRKVGPMTYEEMINIMKKLD